MFQNYYLFEFCMKNHEKYGNQVIWHLNSNLLRWKGKWYFRIIFFVIVFSRFSNEFSLDRTFSLQILFLLRRRSFLVFFEIVLYFFQAFFRRFLIIIQLFRLFLQWLFGCLLLNFFDTWFLFLLYQIVRLVILFLFSLLNHFNDFVLLWEFLYPLFELFYLLRILLGYFFFSSQHWILNFEVFDLFF